MKNIVARFLLVFLPIFAAACGAKQLGTTAQKNVNPPKDTPQKPFCSAVTNPTHVITIGFPHGVPKKVGVRFPSDQNGYHVSDCGDVSPVGGLLVGITKPNANTLVLTVDHNHNYTQPDGTTTLPASQALGIDDLHGCGSGEHTPVVKEGTSIPLLWKMTYPSGTGCPAKLEAAGSGTALPDGSFVPDALDATE